VKKSKVLAKFRSGAFARMCSVGHYLPFFVRYAAEYGHDGIWLDLEHRTMDDREAQAIIAARYYNDIDCMVRPATRGRTHLYHHLEEGATGFMFPIVSTAEEARLLVNAVRFRPLGNRGLDGAGLDADYALASACSVGAYCAAANQEAFILAQNETPEAVANIEDIGAVEGIDCLFVGPADLGLRLSFSDDPARPTVAQAIERVAAAAARHGKAWGTTARSVAILAGYRKMGAQLVPSGGDFALTGVLRRCRDELDGVLAGD